MYGHGLSLRTLKQQNDAFFLAHQSQQAIQYPPYDPACNRLWKFHQSTAKIRLLLGGNRSGKSETGGYELVSLARRYPGEMFWACSNTLDSIGLYVWPKIKKYLHPAEIKTIAWASRVKDIPSQVRLQNGSIFVFKTYDQKRERFQGAAVKAIWLDEECDRGLFLECLARTTDSRGDNEHDEIHFEKPGRDGKDLVRNRRKAGNTHRPGAYFHIPDFFFIEPVLRLA